MPLAPTAEMWRPDRLTNNSLTNGAGFTNPVPGDKSPSHKQTPMKSGYGSSDPEALTACSIANLSDARNSFMQPKQATDIDPQRSLSRGQFWPNRHRSGFGQITHPMSRSKKGTPFHATLGQTRLASHRTLSDNVGTDSSVSADVDDAGGENGSVHGVHEFEAHAAADVLLLEHRAAPS